MDKLGIAPTGDKHDYWSLTPHSWPDPSMPGGLPYKEIPEAVNPQFMSGDYDKAALSKMTEAVNTLSLAYYYTGDERYARHASSFLKIWFLYPETRMNPNLDFGQTFPGRNGGGNIIDAALLIHLPDSLLMLEGSPSWTQQDDEGIREWIRQFAEWMMSSEVGRKGKSAANNHSTWFDVEYITFLLATGQNQAAFHHLQDHSMRLIDLQIDSEGRMPNELNGPKAFHHSLYNLKAFSLLAAAAEHVGVDLWHYQGNRGQSLNAAYGNMAEYLLGKPWPYSGSVDELKSEVMSGMIAAGSIYDTPAIRSAAELLRDKAGFKLQIYGVRGF
ncbi:alginate lyase family protein [Paenibacillus sp. S-38]|uniref:alginate lyase family protein n=1 Tax=Paenibacillus sp. S-38 TaxID=3416710 RepID=UPI003CF6C467